MRQTRTARRRIRVLHVLDTEGFAGTEAHVLTLTRELRAEGVCAYLACCKDTPLSAAARQRHLPAFSLGRFTQRRWRMAFMLRHVAARTRPDVIHAHNGRTMLAAAAVGSLLGIPVVGTQHFIDPNFTTYRGPKRALANAMHGWVNRRLSHVVAVSEAARQAMIARERIESAKVTTVFNGIHAPALPTPGSLDVPQHDLVVTVARLAPEKGLEYLIRAVGGVLSSRPVARFQIVGDGPARGELEALIAELGVGGAVELLGYRHDAAAVIARGKVFVLPSPAEPFGLVLLEAMALGIPVVATRAGGPMEIVDDEETGMLVRPRDPEDLARAVIRLLCEPQTREKMGRCGLERFEKLFTAQRMARDTKAIYERLGQRPVESARRVGERALKARV